MLTMSFLDDALSDILSCPPFSSEGFASFFADFRQGSAFSGGLFFISFAWDGHGILTVQGRCGCHSFPHFFLVCVWTASLGVLNISIVKPTSLFFCSGRLLHPESSQFFTFGDRLALSPVSEGVTSSRR